MSFVGAQDYSLCHRLCVCGFLCQEVLKIEADNFYFSTAGDRREVLQREEKRAELERVVASSDVVGELPRRACASARLCQHEFKSTAST